MKVLSYSAHNVLRLSDIDFNLEGHHLFLVGGKNAQGKTSALTALLMALCGRSGSDYPEIALKEGETEGWVKVQLSGDAEELHEPEGLTVELYLRRKRSGQVVEEFRILDSAGEEAPEPRTLLKRLYNLRAFDPLHFERLDRKAKRELLEKLLGLDFADERAAYNEAYENRAAVNRQVVRLKAKCEAMPHHIGVPDEEVPAATLLEELERRQQVNRDNAARRRELNVRDELIANNQRELERLTRQINELQQQRDKLDASHAVLLEKRATEFDQVQTLADLDCDEIKRQIKDADQTNARVRDNKVRAEAQRQLEQLRSESELITEQLKEIEQQQEQKLSAAPWPIEGLSFDSEGVLYQGLPIEQASKSLRTRLSVKIGMALNPRLRLLVSQAGGDLDDEALGELEQMLRDEDFQMVLELVTRSPDDESRCAVIVRDGRTTAKTKTKAT